MKQAREAASMKYHDVVKKAQRIVKERGEYGNQKVSLYACDTWLNGDQINLARGFYEKSSWCI